MPDSELRIAYFREYESKNCDIRFPLIIESKNGEPITKEIIGLARNTDTLAALKTSIKQRIIELNENNKENDNNKNILLQLPTSPEQIEVEFLKPEKPYRESILLKDFNKLTEEKFIKVLGQKFSIILNAPLVRVLKLPSAICAKFPVVPAIFKSYNLHKEATKFIWVKSKDKEVWEKVGDGYEYDVQESDVDHFLKLNCVPYSKFKIKGPVKEAISEFKVQLISEFPKCPFEDRHAATKERLRGNKLRIVSYNILADRYVDGEQFSYTPHRAIGIHYRKQLIMKELQGYNADIICLQEVDDIHYKTYYQKELKERGYRTYFNRKGNCIPEGLACAFQKNRFTFLDYKHIVLRIAVDRNQFKAVLDVLNLNKEVKDEFMKQNTSLQTIILQDKSTKKIVIVGNTHFYYHPDADHIRLLQAFVTTMHLNNVKNRIMKEYRTSNVAIIFCGDFNSDVVKSLYGFMTRGTIDPEHKDCLKISPSGEASLYHKLHLVSASGTPKYTNYTDEYKGCLDYIFIDSLKLSVRKVIPVPTEKELEKYVGLPNEFYPSDHLSLVVDVEFKTS